MKIFKFGLVLAIAGLFITATAKAPPSPKDLGGGCLEADILFITDWSGSIKSHEGIMVSAFYSFVSGFTLSPDGVKIGIVTFNDNVQVWSPLTSNRERLDSVLLALRFKVADGGTQLNPSLEYAPKLFNQSTIERDQSAMRIIIFMSDGDGSDPVDAIASAKILKDQGVMIYVIGIGSMNTQSKQNLQNIASPDGYIETEYEGLKKTLQRMDLCG